MDPASTVLLVLFALAYPGGIGGAYLGAQWLETRRVARTKRDWASFAAREGLAGGVREERGGFQIVYAGRIRDREVTLTAQSPAPKGGWTEVRVMLDPPMDLGLAAVGQGTPGHRRPDFELHTDDPTRAQALFDDEVRQLCTRLAAVRWIADDLGVRLRFEMFVPDPLSLGPMVGAAIDLVDALDAGRGRVGPASVLAGEAEAWRAIAEGAGLVFGATPLHVRGTIDGIEVSASSRRVDGRIYGLGAEARFEAPLGGVVAIEPIAQGPLAQALRLGAAHATPRCQVDEPAFDAAFRTHARDPGRLPALLPPALVAQLLRVHERTPLVIDDVGIRVVSARLPPASAILPLLRDLADLALQIESNVRGRTAGPYR